MFEIPPGLIDTGDAGEGIREAGQNLLEPNHLMAVHHADQQGTGSLRVHSLRLEHSDTVAQLLLTGEDIRSEQRSRNVRNTLSRLLELGALPVINENDAVATDEIGVENTIGENDTLSAIVAAAIGADLLVLLSDIDGLYDSDPHENPDAKIIPVVGTVDEHIYALAGGKGSALGTGGMVTKLNAAVIAAEAGCEMVIANGSKPELLYDIADGKPVGTRFLRKKG